MHNCLQMLFISLLNKMLKKIIENGCLELNFVHTKKAKRVVEKSIPKLVAHYCLCRGYRFIGYKYMKITIILVYYVDLGLIVFI